MIMVKVILFVLTVFTVKYIFISINNDGDKKVEKMKELINFTQYLRTYSCNMKMSIEEIYNKYNFKSIEVESIVRSLMTYLEENKSSKDLLVYINKIMYTPIEFNSCFAEIIDYYGCTYSEVLDKKLQFTSEEMEKIINEYLIKHNEKKILNNRISFLAGCLAAIILV